MEVDVDMKNPEIMKTVQEVLANFDPTVPLSEEDAVFSAQMTRFDKKEKKQNQKAHVRRAVVKKVEDSYIEQQNEKEARKIEEERERQLRQSNTEAMMRSMEQFEKQSELERQKLEQAEQQRIQDIRETLERKKKYEQFLKDQKQLDKDAKDAEAFKKMEQEFIMRELSSKKTTETTNDRESVSNFVKQ